MNIDQIAAEAAHDIGMHPLWTTEDRAARIKSAVEKGYDQGYEDCRKLWLAERQAQVFRATHASEPKMLADAGNYPDAGEPMPAHASEPHTAIPEL